MSELLSTVQGRRSYSHVTNTAPNHDEILRLVAAAGRVADHSALRPWRIIEIRADARDIVGEALIEAGDLHGHDAEKQLGKVRRAPLLLAIVAVHRPSGKVPEWEQDAVTAGVAHTLSLLLHDAGWGVIWRTGALTRSDAVSRAHGLAAHEQLLGWLYVGGIPDGEETGHRTSIDADEFVSILGAAPSAGI